MKAHLSLPKYKNPHQFHYLMSDGNSGATFFLLWVLRQSTKRLALCKSVLQRSTALLKTAIEFRLHEANLIVIRWFKLWSPVGLDVTYALVQSEAIVITSTITINARIADRGNGILSWSSHLGSRNLWPKSIWALHKLLVDCKVTNSRIAIQETLSETYLHQYQTLVCSIALHSFFCGLFGPSWPCLFRQSKFKVFKCWAFHVIFNKFIDLYWQCLQITAFTHRPSVYLKLDWQ